MLRVLVSGCLGGAAIRFNETGVLVDSPIWRQWRTEGRLVPFCPELAVGFPVPRPAAEIVDGAAADVFDGHGRVLEASGRDVTELFRAAAHRAVQRAIDAHVALAVMVDGSPTCGSSYIYDGTFSGVTMPGRGVAAEALHHHGIPVFPHHQLEQAAAALAELERRSR
ncbi:DUF523 domain-containing protein [Micromonospora ureilytica]|uniref:DUF523 domain-containing protein n=1 Tax=Micromonospora ureilytica TaxID=709868 RepID=UPI002E116DF5|nr:DUF523 domain-containing protein [Micromonospora ureilytica]